jgi:hypothetical protein
VKVTLAATPAATVSSTTIPTAATGPITTVGRQARVVVATEGCLIAGSAPEHNHVTIAATTATETPTKAIAPISGRSVAATKIAASDPNTTAIQIKFFANSLPAGFIRCPDERMAIASFAGAGIPLLVTLRK